MGQDFEQIRCCFGCQHFYTYVETIEPRIVGRGEGNTVLASPLMSKTVVACTIAERHDEDDVTEDDAEMAAKEFITGGHRCAYFAAFDPDEYAKDDNGALIRRQVGDDTLYGDDDGEDEEDDGGGSEAEADDDGGEE